jgi:hypothetical protein
MLQQWQKWGGGEDTLTNAGGGVTFNKADATVNFENQLRPPPATATITQQQGTRVLPSSQLPNYWGVDSQPNPHPNPHLHLNKLGYGGGQQAPKIVAYSGIDSALQQLGHTMYDPATINAELCVQSGVNLGNAASWTAFRDFVVNIQQFQVYLAMLGGQPHVSMIHTPGVYYSIASSTSAYQGKVLAFIGDWRATKEPTLVCLPMTKLWDWHTGNAITDFTKCEEFYPVEANKGTLWMPGAGDGALAKIKVPNLVAIPNALVNLLHMQGPAITPHNVLATIDNFIQNSGQPVGQKWEYVQK